MNTRLIRCSYNSVIFNTLSANEYQATLGNHEFLTGGWWNHTRVAYMTSPFDLSYVAGSDRHGPEQSVYVAQLEYMQNHQSKLHQLENRECLQVYGDTIFESSWRNVLVVSNITLQTSYLPVLLTIRTMGLRCWAGKHMRCPTSALRTIFVDDATSGLLHGADVKTRNKLHHFAC